MREIEVRMRTLPPTTLRDAIREGMPVAVIDTGFMLDDVVHWVSPSPSTGDPSGTTGGL